MIDNNDSTQIRAGEELDVGALEKYLGATLLPQCLSSASQPTLELRQFPGGHSNLTYLVRYAGNEFVLRRPPLGPVATTAHDMPREYRLLSVIYPAFPLAPKPILLCEDASILGVPFYLMERRQGFILRSELPKNVVDDLQLRASLSENVVDTLIALHDVDIHSTAIAEIGKPKGFVQRQVHGWAGRWQRSRTSDIPEMEEVIVWLKDRTPPENLTDAAIVHNDFKLDNLMFDRQEPARVVAVLDWEMCAVGDPLIDVGLFLSYWTMKGDNRNSSLRAVTNGPGWLTREQIIDRYASATGRDLSRIVFYETFARFKVAVVIQQIFFRYARGQTTDERFRKLDVMVKELITEALEMAHGSQI